ncbi:MAG: threonine synthase [Leptospirales bacterium]|nr:threonine synthase [Leptospirales bacterium]
MIGQVTFTSELACINCDRTYTMDAVRYLCDCGGLLEVRHNEAAIVSRSPSEWQGLFESRYRSSVHPYSSGVWGKKEWVLPGISESNVVTLGEGATPMLPVPRLAAELGVRDIRVKQCGVSHTGSFKDLGMTVLVSHVVHLRSLGVPIRAVACASTGDTSAALAAYAASAGIPTVVFLPAGKISNAQLSQPVSNGSVVLSLDTDFDGCMEIVKAVTADQSIYLANSMNPLRIEGQKTISIEICQQLGWDLPDWLVIPGGNLGNVSALAAGLDLLKLSGITRKSPRILLAQSANANPMYLSYQNDFKFQSVPAKTTLASAIQIGNPVSFPRAVRALQAYNGVVDQATEQELSDAAARADRHGLFNDPHTGVALAAMMKQIEKGTIKRDESVVVISTAHGLKFQEFKSGYHAGALPGVQGKHRNEIIRLPADVSAVKKALDAALV